MNLKSFSVDFSVEVVSTIIRVPAFLRLSSLQISADDGEDWFLLHATGEGITLSTRSNLQDIAEVWHDLVGYARPTIRHIRLHADVDVNPNIDDAESTVASLLLDAHTLEIGAGYFPDWYDGFLNDLKQLGPQLKTIRIAIPDHLEPFRTSDSTYEYWGGAMLDKIKELVRYRYEQGRPFSVVERVVVDESERSNRHKDYLWRCFYGGRKLGRYVQSG